MQLARGVLATRSDFAAAAELLHRFCFDRVELETPRLSYEPRGSCQCTRCAAVWIALKSGTVMRIALRTPTGRPVQRWFPGNREARTMDHHHGGGALGEGCHLLIGRDDGALDIISDDHREWADQPQPQRRPESIGSFHLDSWWERHDRGPVPVQRGIERAPDTRGHTSGITAVAVLARPGQRDAVDILAATRYPWLYLLEATRGTLRLRQRLAMPGWIEWIIAPQPGDDRLVLIARGGEIVRASLEELLEGHDVRPMALSLLPTAAMPLGRGGVVLGTTTGLFLIRAGRDHDAYSEGIAVPVTRAPVLCLDQVELSVDGEPYHHVILGLENRRLRVIDARLLAAFASGEDRPRNHDRSFAIEMDDAVLAVEALRPDDGPRDAAYVLAVLRDHSVCLFHVTSPQAQRARVIAAWEQLVYGPGAVNPPPQVAAELAEARGRPPAGWDAGGWKYMLVDVVLPRLRGLVRARTDERAQVVALACQLAAGADRYVLHRLSTILGRLAGDDVGLSLELSRAILAAVPHGKEDRWAAFIDSHLRELNALARSARGGNRARLVAWARFVRKYVLLGHRFDAKQLGLIELVEQNHEIGKYFDALIYQTRLSQRGYDLRWDSRLGEEAAEVHTVVWPDRAIVVAATVGGKLVFCDEATGCRLMIQHGGVREVLAPFDHIGPVRTLACAIARDGGRFRVVLSCTAARVPPPGLVVITARPDGAHTVVVESIAHAVCELDDEDAAHVRVYALQPLPEADDFVAGLETRRAPVGRLSKHGETWRLELARDGVTGHDGFVDRPSLAPGKMPTRALAVAAVDDRASGYLLVAGSDDGLLRAIAFARGDPAARWQITQGDRVADAITSVALGRHRRPPGTAAADDSRFSCYVGTAAGDTLAFSIAAPDPPGAAGAPMPFGDHIAQPLWRETHEGPVVAVRLWRTPLYAGGEVDGRPEPAIVLAVATAAGRLCIYNHLPYAGAQRVSASGNYYFRGMRFDRITLPDRVHALSVENGTVEVIAAGPGGQLYKARLVYLRDSRDRRDPERREHWPPPDGALPTELWQRQHHLLAASRIEEPFEVDAARRDALKLALCDLIRLEGGALSAYVLRERLRFQEPWTELAPEQVTTRAQQLLLSLDPEQPEEAEKIKVVLKTLCRSFLPATPDELRAQLLAASPIDPAWHARAAAACEAVAEHLTRDLGHSTRAAARLRIVGIKELLRVDVLHHIAAGGAPGKRIHVAVEAAIDSCLRDDERLVRIETLRALSVMLRNVGVMADTIADEADRARFVAALFPRGLGSITWLLALIVGGLQRFPSFARRTALVSGAWYYIKALLGLFRIFPDRTLALCDYLVRHGLGVEVLAMCCQSLRRAGSATIRSRITQLYLLPAAESQAEYIARYDIRKPGHSALLAEIKLAPQRSPDGRAWYELDDAAMAHRLIGALDRLARMWSIGNEDQMRQDLPVFRAAGARAQDLAARDVPVGELERVADALAAIAEDLVRPNADAETLERLSTLGKLHGPSHDDGSPLTTPLRAIVSRIADTWREVYSPPLAERGAVIGGYKLGAPLGQGGFGRLFAIDEPLDRRDRFVIKVLHRNSPSAARRFLEGARFNKELSDRSFDRRYVVQVIDIIDERPRLAYVMRRYHKVLEQYLSRDPRAEPGPEFHASPHAIAWTEQVAIHIGCALRAAHMRDRWHGDVKPTNILVNIENAVPVFRLGDFDLASDDTTESSVTAVGVVPMCLSRKAWNHDHQLPGHGAPSGALPLVHPRQWNDIAALSLTLYRMLTGETIKLQDTLHLGPQLERLRVLAQDDRIRGVAQRVVQTLIEVFDPGVPPFSIHVFLRDIFPPAESQQVRILFLAANASKDTQLALGHEVTKIRQWIQYGEAGRKCHLEDRWEVQAERLHMPILEVQPDILHFSCHGNDAGELVLHGPGGEGAPAPIDAVTGVFRILRERVRCVVLSACYSEAQARAIAEHVDVVIGMSGAIPDEDAIAFAGVFYGALGMGSHVQEAFDLAGNNLTFMQYERRRVGRDVKKRRPVADAERPTPQLHVRRGFDPRTLYFVKRRTS